MFRRILPVILLLSSLSQLAAAQYFHINRAGKKLESSSDEDYALELKNPALMPYKEKVGEETRFGFINRQGKKVTPPIYEWAAPSDGDFAIVRGKSLTGTLVDTNGKEQFALGDYVRMEGFYTPDGPIFKVQKGDDWGIMRANGSYLLGPRPERIDLNPTTIPGIFEVEVDNSKDQRQLFSIARGLYGEKFVEGKPFSEGMMVVRCRKGGKWGAINAAGKLVVPCKYEEARNGGYHAGQAHFDDGKGKRTILDKEGREIAPVYEDVYYTDQGGLMRFFQSGRVGFMDAAGTMAIPAVYEDAEEFSYGLAMVKKDGSFGYIDRSGNIVVPITLKAAAKQFNAGLAKVTTADGREQYIDIKGRPALNNLPGKLVSDFYEGRAVYSANGKFGYIDSLGRDIIPAQFDNARIFASGRAAVQLNGRWGFINTDGYEAIPFHFGTINDFKSGVAWVSYSEDRIDVRAEAQAAINKEKAAEARRFARTAPPPPDPNACQACGGSGYEDAGDASCGSCRGAGSKTCTSCRGGYTYNMKGESSYCSICRGAGTTSCYTCFGSGKVAGRDKSCGACSGTGRKGK